jgi:3-isopropylmalate dehydrogenase
MKAGILLLPGDGLDPGVLAGSRRVLESMARLDGHDLALVEGRVGASALGAACSRGRAWSRGGSGRATASILTLL